LTTVAETDDLFNLGPLIVFNLHCIPTVVEMQPRLRNRWLFLKKRPAEVRRLVGGGAAGSGNPRRFTRCHVKSE